VPLGNNAGSNKIGRKGETEAFPSDAPQRLGVATRTANTAQQRSGKSAEASDGSTQAWQAQDGRGEME
jgi:hypothetical protein